MRVGIEIEFTGISRNEAADVLVKHFNSFKVSEEYSDKGEVRHRHKVTNPFNGDNWYIVEDRSIQAYVCGKETFCTDYMCELVTPVLENFSDLEAILGKLSNSGAIVNTSCGCHIHIDCPKGVVYVDNLIRTFFNDQDKLKGKWCIPNHRLNNYCKLFPRVFIEGYLGNTFTSIEEIKDYFYDNLSKGESRNHCKNSARYYALNIDSIHKRNTIELRFFNSTLCWAVFKTYLEYIRSIQEVQV